MEPVFKHIETFWLLGVQVHARPDEVNYPEFWGQIGPRLAEIAPVATEQVAYGAYFCCADGFCDVFGGMAVPADTPVPDGMVMREVPAAQYAMFECDMASIGATWTAIFHDWLPTSGYVSVEHQPCFEVFAEGCHEGLVPVRIHTAVVRAG